MKRFIPGYRASALLTFLTLAYMSQAVFGYSGNNDFLALSYTDGFESIASDNNGGDRLKAKLTYVIRQAGVLTTDDGDTLLPAGTTLDSLLLDENNIARLALTLPKDADLKLMQPVRMTTIEQVLGRALAQEVNLEGIVIQLRVGQGPYLPVDSYLIPFDPPPDSDVSDDTGKTAAEAIEQRRETEDTKDRSASMSIGGPVAHADGQPAGALSGVVVFVSAGHGWTAGSTSWYLQRPLLLEMNEDYGNLEQLNYLVNYLYNAGAVVVPFRPVGYKTTEIVLDNDDPGVTFIGIWQNSSTSSGYYENGITISGIPYKYAYTNPTETATARYTPNIPSSDFYPVYCWTKDDTDRVEQIYRIQHSGAIAEVAVDHARVGKGWIWLGNYYFEEGTSGYVEITNISPLGGIVVADAIRFGNGMGDIVRPGPGTISGYPREEECSRYWGESEAGNNAVGLPNVWECSGCNDGSDNVGTAARWSAVMNRQNINDERWRRVYIEYHTNAAGCSPPPCGAKGTVCLVSSSYPTTYQQSYATILGDKIEADMLLIDEEFEYLWGLRSNPYSGGFGAISTYNNDNEFDATIVEVAFHDNEEDAANLRSAKVRDAVARSSLQGIIMFLNSLPGSGVPLIFPPDPPERVQAAHDGNGNIIVSWSAPPSGGASGDPPTGYKIYRSTNGYGFGNAILVGNVLNASVSDIPSSTTTYLRVATFNAGGESMPSETLAVCRPTEDTAKVLIVNGYDRVSRHQNYIQTIPQGPMERPIARYVNSFDYVVQHANALAASGYTFDSCANDAVIEGTIDLTVYEDVVWILGRESQEDKTFDSTEQTLVINYLNQGGNLFVTGTDIGYELDALGAGQTFYEDTLGADYAGDDSGTFTVVGTGEILSDVGTFDFDPANGAPYAARSPDRIVPQPGATNILSYVGGTGDGAGIQFDSGNYRVIMFGFPFETISSEADQVNVMQRVMQYLVTGLSSSCGRESITNFEGYLNGTRVMFQHPRYSGTTVNYLTSRPNYAGVSDSVSAFDGLKAYELQWNWLDASPSNWLRLTTSDTINVPNPTIDLRRAVRLRLRLDSGSFRLCLGIRETGVDVPLGEDGGTSGTIEWVGATSVVGTAPQGILVTAQPGVWQTFTFIPTSENVLGFTGNGVLDAPNHKGVLEHLAFAVNDTAGPFQVYLDTIEQPCPPSADFDNDGDVDQEDFGHFQACLTGTDTPQNDPDCQDAKLDGDSDVDQEDFAIIQSCLSGANIPVDPECGS
ncbi:MAG: hypothetical protein JSV03_11180 [Planctomycetota bacterium]|nr:MAG: hypothetical protein JSV03_11180 [Planctomycetota bacterium]